MCLRAEGQPTSQLIHTERYNKEYLVEDQFFKFIRKIKGLSKIITGHGHDGCGNVN